MLPRAFKRAHPKEIIIRWLNTNTTDLPPAASTAPAAPPRRLLYHNPVGVWLWDQNRYRYTVRIPFSVCNHLHLPLHLSPQTIACPGPRNISG